jgi:hypothetical protein
MEQSLVAAWVMTIGIRVVGLILFPALISIAAIKLWGIVQPWIPAVFLINALVSVLNSLPSILISVNMMDMKSYSAIAVPFAIISLMTHLMFGVACLALALTVRKALIEQKPAPYSIS